MKIPVIVQMQNSENGATALCMILGYYRKFVPIDEMREICISSRNGSSPEAIQKAAAVYGLDASIRKIPLQDLKEQDLPVMIRWKRRYYAIIKSIRGNIVTVLDPAQGTYKLEFQKLEQLYTGTAIFFEKSDSFQAGGRRESLYDLIKDRMKPLLKPMILLAFFTLLCVGINLIMIELEKTLLDQYMKAPFPDEDIDGYSILTVYLLLMIIYFVISILKTRKVNKTSRQVSAQSGIRLFKKIFHQPLRFFEQYSAFELISRIENNITLDSSILKSLVPRFIDAGMSIVYLVFLFHYNAIIAAVCILVMVVSVLLSLKVQERHAITSKSMMTSSNIVNASLLNGMNMIDTIQSTGGEKSFFTMWHRSQSRFNSNRQIQFRFSALSNLIQILSRNTLQAVILFMGAYFVVHGNFTLGSMALFQGILGSMINAVNNCISTMDSLQTMRTNIERVNDINQRSTREPIPLEESDMETAAKLEGRLCARDICFRYNPGDDLALDHVSIEVNPGQMIAIVGSTGCGKSTLLKILADVYEAESGEVLYAGKKRCEIPDVVFHSSVSTVDQETVMFEDSVYNNIKMWDSTIENYEVILAARDAQIHNRIIREKKDYGTPMEENGRNFSGGELQRIELARALAHEPTLLLLDEFTSALDALTEDKAMKALREKGTTCIIVAHRLSTIVDCDRIYVMDHGQIVQQGTHEELYSQEGLYRTLVG